MSVNERLQEAISLAITDGHQLDIHAFKFLQKILQTTDPVKLMEKALKRISALNQKPLFIGQDFLENVAKELIIVKEEKESDPFVTAKIPYQVWSQGVNSEVKVVKDPTEGICKTGTLKEYLEYFQDRFRRLRKILIQRIDARDAISISEVYKISINSEVKVIGMISEKREHKGRIFLTIEDLESIVTVLVPQNADWHVLEKSRNLLLDQVACIIGVKGRGNLLIAKDFILPDMPQRRPNKASIPAFAVLTSDLHVGSNKFMHEEFNRFLLWLNCKFGTPEMREIASHVKYLVIAGDLVDGIGVYPGQGRELEIQDIYHQYQVVASLIEQIPEHIEVIIVPGNHDATRKAMPQPAIPSEYLEPLYGSRKVYSIGNPCVVTLHGIELLVSHGRSLDDIMATVSSTSFQTPDKAMKVLLKSRHLAPIYGKKTPIAPERNDFMVIEKPPDIFHMGHVHVMKYSSYRGTLVVNSGAWQRQTEFQRKMGLEPTPGIVPIVNLQTLDIKSIDFKAS